MLLHSWLVQIGLQLRLLVIQQMRKRVDDAGAVCGGRSYQ